MYLARVIATCSIASISLCVFAQESLVGKYSGSYVSRAYGGDRDVGLTINVTSVENNVVKGTATNYSQGCAGDYPFEGKLNGTDLVLRSSKKGGRAGDCGFGFRGNVEGNALVGNMGSLPVKVFK